MYWPPILIPATCMAVTRRTRKRLPKNVPAGTAFPPKMRVPPTTTLPTVFEEVGITEAEECSSDACRDQDPAKRGKDAANHIGDGLDKVYIDAAKMRRFQILSKSCERFAELRVLEHKGNQHCERDRYYDYCGEHSEHPVPRKMHEQGGNVSGTVMRVVDEDESGHDVAHAQGSNDRRDAQEKTQ